MYSVTGCAAVPEGDVLTFGDQASVSSDRLPAPLPAPVPAPLAPGMANQLCTPDPSIPDRDNDGFTIEEGDCDDCNRLINPGAFDFPDNGRDDDCDGRIDAAGVCDQAIEPDTSLGFDAARAMGICNYTREDLPSWGVIQARFTSADGLGSPESPKMVGVPSSFGAALPREGSRLLALSTGVARARTDVDFTPHCDTFDGGAVDASFWNAPAPPGSADGGCQFAIGEDLSLLFNSVAFEVTLRVPTNALAMSFDSIFYTYEYPLFVCSPYNDYYVVLLDPPEQGARASNIAFDRLGNPLSVNSALLQVCEPGEHGGKTFECPEGTELLAGTGYDSFESTCAQEANVRAGERGAATGWLRTYRSVEPGSVITLRFAIWDTGDPLLDSTVLIDNLRWWGRAETAQTVPI